MLLITLGILTLVSIVPRKLKAQNQPAAKMAGGIESPFAPGVARVSSVIRDLSIMRIDPQAWVAATTNSPVFEGDTVATGPGSRAELELDFANVLRLDQNTEAIVAELTRTQIQIQVATGLVSITVFKDTEADIEIDTPNMAIHPSGEGVYRIQVNSAEDSQLSVRKGHAGITTSQGGMNINKGQVIHVKGAESPVYQLAPSNDQDDWDQWNVDRDHTIADAQAWQHTNHFCTGSEDLDRYGDWAQVPGYGWCWTPYVDAGWAPYRDGRWVADSYYGWMWVGYEPWGWAPYHYGRWVSYGGNWCWWPGVGVDGPRPIWSPGYVAFLGFGASHEGSGQAVGFDAIGWCPLGPRDHFNPWWGRGQSYNPTDMSDDPAPGSNAPSGPAYGSNLQRVMADADLRGAITVVSSEDFANGSMGRNPQPLNENQLLQGNLIEGPLPVSPTKASVQLVNRPVNPAALPAVAANKQRFFGLRPRPASRASLPAGLANPKASGLRAGGNASTPAASLAPAAPSGAEGSPQGARTVARTAGPVAGQPGTRPGWSRFGTPAAIGTAPTAPIGTAPPPTGAPPSGKPRPATPENHEDGWHHFSSPPAHSKPGAEGSTPQNQSGWNRVEARPIGTESLSNFGG